MRSHSRPVLVYDGDCGFCTRCVRVVERMGVDCDVVAWQLADLPELGLTQDAAAESVKWLAEDGSIRSGHAAIASVLMRAGKGWALLGRAICLPGMSWIAGAAYRFVADNRQRLPGGTPACALPADQRPGTATKR